MMDKRVYNLSYCKQMAIKACKHASKKKKTQDCDHFSKPSLYE